MNLASWIILAVVAAVVALAVRATLFKGKHRCGRHDAADGATDEPHCMSPCEDCPAVQCKASANTRSRT